MTAGGRCLGDGSDWRLDGQCGGFGEGGGLTQDSSDMDEDGGRGARKTPLGDEMGELTLAGTQRDME